MDFIPLYCPIKHADPKKSSYLCDVEAGVAVTMRCTCRQKHAPGHIGRVELRIDLFGNITWKEIKNETDKNYCSDGVRIGGG